MTLSRLRARRRAILGVLDRRGLANPRVFGSVASGQADAESDVDLAVDWAPGRRPRGFAYYSAVADAQRELSELLGVPVIGEACGAPPDDFKSRHPDVDWKGWRDFRNLTTSELARSLAAAGQRPSTDEEAEGWWGRQRR